MRELILLIKIKPLAKQSVRQGRSKSGKNVFYQDTKYKQWRESVQWQIKAQLPKDWQIYSKQVVINKLTYCFKSKSTGPKVTRSDLDNLGKELFDSMNKLVYEDDSLIWRIEQQEKIYCDEDSITIVFTGI